jgi:CBS-domain-containing membrane protein
VPLRPATGDALMSTDSGGAAPKLMRDLMTLGVVTCSPRLSLAELARLFLERDVEGVIVLDEEGHASGAITQDELIRAYAHPAAGTLTAADIMRDDIPELPPDIPLHAAAQLMQDMGVRAVFSLHHDRGIAWPSAIFTYRHILRHLAAESPDELRDLGIRAERRPPLEVFIEKRDAARRQSKPRNQE